jgi:hypothetical protein
MSNTANMNNRLILPPDNIGMSNVKIIYRTGIHRTVFNSAFDPLSYDSPTSPKSDCCGAENIYAISYLLRELANASPRVASAARNFSNAFGPMPCSLAISASVTCVSCAKRENRRLPVRVGRAQKVWENRRFLFLA